MSTNQELIDSINSDIYQLKVNIDSPQNVNLIRNLFNSLRDKNFNLSALIEQISILDISSETLKSKTLNNTSITNIPKTGYYYCSVSNNVTGLPNGVSVALVEAVYIDSTTIFIKIIDVNTSTLYTTSVTHGQDELPEWLNTQGKFDEKADLSITTQKTSDTGSAKLPVGDSSERDIDASDGYIRYNKETLGFEGFSNGMWQPVGGGQMLGQSLIKAVSYNAQTIGENIVVPAGLNAYSVGNVTVEAGNSITIEAGSVYKIL